MIETELTYSNFSLCESQWQCLHNYHMVIHDVCTLSCNRKDVIITILINVYLSLPIITAFHAQEMGLTYPTIVQDQVHNSIIMS